MKPAEKPVCFVCGATGPGIVFLRCVHDGQEKFVCVRCLPVLIHGQH
jgi:hypothetical protein